MAESVLFRGGTPYGPDVNRLKESFPVTKLTEGTVIKHEELEAIVRQPKGSQRYYGVVNSWIHQQRNENAIFIIWVPAIGLKVLDPADTMHCWETRTRQKIKQTGKAISLRKWVDRTRLDEIGQRRFDHQVRVTNGIHDAMLAARRELSVDIAPVKSLPKPQLIKPESKTG